MASIVGIYNLALAHFGQDSNISATTEQSIEAEKCNQFYPIALNFMLEDFAWTFASKRMALALLTETLDPWLYGYAMPADCIKPRRLLPAEAFDDHAGVRFLSEGSKLYSNEPDPVLVYTYALTDTTKFSGQFTTALSWLLASYICGPIMKDTTGRTQSLMFQTYEREVAKAKAGNANSDRNPQPYVPSSIAARLSNMTANTLQGGPQTEFPNGFEVQ